MLLERANQQHLALVATFSLPPSEQPRAAIGLEVQLGVLHLFTGLVHERASDPGMLTPAWQPGLPQ